MFFLRAQYSVDPLRVDKTRNTKREGAKFAALSFEKFSDRNNRDAVARNCFGVVIWNRHNGTFLFRPDAGLWEFQLRSLSRNASFESSTNSAYPIYLHATYIRAYIYTFAIWQSVPFATHYSNGVSAKSLETWPMRIARRTKGAGKQWMKEQETGAATRRCCSCWIQNALRPLNFITLGRTWASTAEIASRDFLFESPSSG